MYQGPFKIKFDNGEVVVYKHIIDVAHAVLNYSGDVNIEDAYGPIPIEDVLSCVGF